MLYTLYIMNHTTTPNIPEARIELSRELLNQALSIAARRGASNYRSAVELLLREAIDRECQSDSSPHGGGDNGDSQ